ncbi:NLI interacting factor-like phosphatase-domain-containing protein [Tricharina praecox]|uniref:NLI interacting factor-like phosphatase-domain-containing protein n=1 Tax=Tricharina praecox TaxID=43433 RepID=UPI00221F02C6|nr:NLI interacting factor-like phosphatase-domain-containing protein [Tricharina praecox]KAI5857125.1 NLI interacting factor-like phosphatase-domain-containing protein [Tricharina praecox]
MNSLSILSSRVNKVIGNTPPPTPQTNAFHQEHRPTELLRTRHAGAESFFGNQTVVEEEEEDGRCIEDDGESEAEREVGGGAGGGRMHDDTRVWHNGRGGGSGGGVGGLRGHMHMSVGERIYLAMLSPWFGAVRWIISTIATSTHWLVACVYDDEGVFSPLMPFRRAAGLVLRSLGKDGNKKLGAIPEISLQEHISASADDPIPEIMSSGTTSHHRAKSFGGGGVEDISPRRSIRIRLYNEETQKNKASSSVKSPTSPSPSLRLTKYPRAAGPPVPLLSRKPSTKTLILDLDETLIHSLAKGSRMSSGHMVEVKLDRQHAILYYVHKRPYCDEFLRKVAQWYNLVVFTASVQEYADPVIDWLEQDRKYFSGRYYRQHCTNRNGAYIKDLATVEPDLSKVMIIDNSPMSYIFHEDNAIPIEGWINDPTDIDLLHLIPLLQALQYVADVRALLALRMGESPS